MPPSCSKIVASRLKYAYDKIDISNKPNHQGIEFTAKTEVAKTKQYRLNIILQMPDFLVTWHKQYHCKASGWNEIKHKQQKLNICNEPIEQFTNGSKTLLFGLAYYSLTCECYSMRWMGRVLSPGQTIILSAAEFVHLYKAKHCVQKHCQFVHLISIAENNRPKQNGFLFSFLINRTDI